MKFKDFKNNSYGLEAKEIPPRPKTFEDVYEDIKIKDPTGMVNKKGRFKEGNNE